MQVEEKKRRMKETAEKQKEGEREKGRGNKMGSKIPNSNCTKCK